MRIIKFILIFLAGIVVIAAIAGMFMNSKFAMEKSMVINADQKIIFDQVNTLKNWEQWSPWLKMDPETKLTYDGPPSGVGASYSWVSSKMGEGTLTISESIPYESVGMDMDFKENGKALAGFRIAKADGGNNVTWWFEFDMGANPFKKVFFNLMGRNMMSDTFNQGLQDIKKISESTPPPPQETIPAMPDTTVSDTIKAL